MSGLYATLSRLSQEPPSLRKANIEDFFDCNLDNIPKQHNQRHNDDYIEKNQENYGHRKRIKP
jgi:hypothetical protein